MTYGLMSTETKTYLYANSVTGWQELCGQPRGMTEADEYVCHLIEGHDSDCLYGSTEDLGDCYEITLICDGALDEVFNASLQASAGSLDIFMTHLKAMLDIEKLSSYIIEARHFIHTEGDSPVQVRRYFADDEVV